MVVPRDAEVVDTTKLTQGQVVEHIVGLARARAGRTATDAAGHAP